MHLRSLAREWLYFLGLLFVGLVPWPLLVRATIGANLPGFYMALLGDAEKASIVINCWLLVLLPYLIVQLIRSIGWAVRQVRADR